MMNVLIVDDEELLRKGLRTLVSWEKFGCRVVGEASNGVEALEFINGNEVHIVITDIRMPVMDGLELMKEIYSRYQHIKVIIVSGYADFAYAKTAIQYNACCYVLKPIDEDEINEAVLHAKNNVEQAQEIETMQKQIKENLLQTMIEDSSIYGNNYKTLLKGIDLDLDLYKDYFCVSIGTIKNQDYKVDSFNQQEVMKYMKDLINLHDSGEVFFINPYQFCIILGYTQHYFEEKTIFTKIIDMLETRENVLCAIGVGRLYDHINDIPKSYTEAKKALKYSINYKNSTVIHFEKIMHNKYVGYEYPLEEEGILLKEIIGGQSQSIHEALNNFFSKLYVSKHISIDSIKAIIIELIITIKRYLTQYKLEEELNYNKIFEMIWEENNIKNIELNLHNKLVKANNIIIRSKCANTHYMIERAKAYVEAHFADKFTLDDVVKEVFVSKSYFCKIFKEKTGVSFGNYLNDFRIEKAKILLRDTEYKNYEISLKVGFEDSSYFNHLFKQKVGITPVEYRNTQVF